MAGMALGFLFAPGFALWPERRRIHRFCRSRLLPALLGRLPLQFLSLALGSLLAGALLLRLLPHRTLLAQGLFALVAWLVLLAGQLRLLARLLRPLSLLCCMVPGCGPCFRSHGGCAAMFWPLLAQKLILSALLF